METIPYKVEERACYNHGARIYGRAYIPDLPDRLPTVILSHELQGSYKNTDPYARILAANGFAAYTFDFCGGSTHSASDKKTTDMSVMTEVADLNAVIDTVKTWETTDPSRIILIGFSQGGVVSAIAAARRPDEIYRLVLLYPAFVIHDELVEWYKSKEEIPDTIDYHGWLPVGRIYAADMYDYDVYKEIGRYQKPVLLLHGDRDRNVDYSYSEKALSVYPDARLCPVRGGGHIFKGKHIREAAGYILDFLRERSGTAVIRGISR